ncbi:MAG: hypothetical protein JWO19_2068 [Bryobacterales bacterium]|nr:hypothetical protein [Bryobacterales bacterium]
MVENCAFSLVQGLKPSLLSVIEVDLSELILQDLRLAAPPKYVQDEQPKEGH